MTLKKIISGGQTGVDRGALDAALAAGFDCGGWVPGDRRAEDGVISERYPLTVLPNGNYRQRTRLNVVDSDGTAVIYNELLIGGARLTRNLCALLNRPYLLINAREIPDTVAAAVSVLKFIERSKIVTLNVSGPRETRWSAGHVFSFAVLRAVIEQSRENARRAEIRPAIDGI